VPDSAVILGGGPVGIELTQMPCRFGCIVKIVEQADRLLAREDGRASELIEDTLKHDGIRVHTGAELENVAPGGRAAHGGAASTAISWALRA
jgi:pyruvate/2-oxoglutarate dehydrogenase complex dihydrolipoamide dehydrogenase (E3) component